MNDMKQKINSWSKVSYGDMLEARLKNGGYSRDESSDIARYVIKAQKLYDKPMNGNSTNGLDLMEREVGNFQYVNVFNIISKAQSWTPMDMVYGTCYLANKDPNVEIMARKLNLKKEDLISKMCGRALRALPSYLREHDLKDQLKAKFPNATFKQNQALDTILHVDLMMKYKDNDYYFWSFVNTNRSLRNFEDKFLGHRAGYIPDGIHITCPFNLNNCDEIDGWKLYDNLVVSEIADMIEYPDQAKYENVQAILNSRRDFFSRPRIINKDDSRTVEMDREEEELCIGSR